MIILIIQFLQPSIDVIYYLEDSVLNLLCVVWDENLLYRAHSLRLTVYR